MITKEMKNAAAFVFKEDDDEKIPIGTGFWVENENESFFVIAKHIIEDLTEIYIRMNTERPATAADKARHTIRAGLKKSSQKNKFLAHSNTDKKLLFQRVELTKNQPLFHKNPAIDIAAIHIKPKKNAQCFMINAGMLVDNDFVEKVGVIEGDDVFFIGLLPQFFGKLRNTPVVRTGKVALITNELFEDEEGKAPYFYIEAHCFPGNSGSPVFMRLASMDANGVISYAGNMVMLLGVLSGYLNQFREVRKGTKISKFNFDENVHIAMVSPANGILDIIKDRKKSS